MVSKGAARSDRGEEANGLRGNGQGQTGRTGPEREIGRLIVRRCKSRRAAWRVLRFVVACTVTVPKSDRKRRGRSCDVVRFNREIF